MTRAVEVNLPPGTPSARQRALALVACVGGTVLARSIDNAALTRDLREAARADVLAASGWG